MQGRPLPVVALVLVEVVVRVVLQERDQGALAHFVLLQEVTKHHERFKYLRSLPGLARDVLRFRGLGVDEPFEGQLAQIGEFEERTGEGGEAVVLDAQGLQLLAVADFLGDLRDHV